LHELLVVYDALDGLLVHAVHPALFAPVAVPVYPGPHTYFAHPFVMV
jgi:hypothetical protein